MQDLTLTVKFTVARKRTESAYKALHCKAVSVIAIGIIAAKIALMLCFCAVAAYRSEYLISAVELMLNIGIISVIVENWKGRITDEENI